MSIWTDFCDLFFPRFCITCNTKLIPSEKFLCLHCNEDLHRLRYKEYTNNKAAQLFFGKFKFEIATAIFQYDKGSKVQTIIHRLKYNDNPELAFQLGKWAAYELNQNNPAFFESAASGIDYLVPVPLHPKREKERGYNQSEQIAKGISEVTKIPVLKSCVRRTRHIETQTQKSVHQRWENVQSIFEANPTLNLEGKHLLLIDDVITTGSTISSCACALHKKEDITLSIFALALA